MKGSERGEFEKKKDELDIVSQSLRDCLGLSFEGIYIYLFSYIIGAQLTRNRTKVVGCGKQQLYIKK